MTALLSLLVALAPASPVPAQGADPAPAVSLPELTLEALPRWREHLRASVDELAYEAIPWIPDLAGGLERAEAEGKPLLLWAMNGHPLGCT